MATEITREELISEANRRLLKATGETSAQITERVAEQIAGEWYGLTDCSDNALIALLVSELGDAELYANGRATSAVVVKNAQAQVAFEDIIGWLSQPSGPDEAKCALARATDALEALQPKQVPE
jgi:hypothetical protein